MDSIQHGEHASDSGADGESQNHAEIVSGRSIFLFKNKLKMIYLPFEKEQREKSVCPTQ